MITRILIATGLATGLFVSAANAVTVTNLDKNSQSVTFTPKGGHAHHYNIAAHRDRSIDCKSGGELSLGKLTRTCDAKTARISIKNGKFAM